ncbi:MFS transporter [Moorella sulfitireducens]|uniref:MFS transporter n=1 Tax=Neomoorella sulfitireducens TaxID=2972948 RepID=UPI0021AD1715|nr:MFS transporter [Moorella sulfitireducens]
MKQSEGKIKLAILSVGILMMGIMAIASGLSVIAQHFTEVSQLSIQLLITLPCIIIIIVTPIVGKLQEYISMKTLVLLGILCFLVGGVVPAFLTSFTLILVCRAILGVGIGTVQVLCPAMVAAYFEGDERSNVMGQLSSAQMIGCAVMVFASGYLAMMGWNITFYVHLIALISLFCVAVFLPHTRPIKGAGAEGGPAEKVELTGAAYGWALTMLIFFISGLILATYLAFFVADHNLGTAAQAGQATMLFAIGGFLMGLVYGRLAQWAKNTSLAVGLFIGVVSYLIIAFAPNIFMVYLGSLIYGFSVTTVFASIMVGTSMSVKPIAVPLATSFVVAGQNLGSFLCPYIITPVSALMSSDVNMFAFITGAILFAIMGIIALIWGMAKNARPSAPTNINA